MITQAKIYLYTVMVALLVALSIVGVLSFASMGTQLSYPQDLSPPGRMVAGGLVQFVIMIGVVFSAIHLLGTLYNNERSHKMLMIGWAQVGVMSILLVMGMGMMQSMFIHLDWMAYHPTTWSVESRTVAGIFIAVFVVISIMMLFTHFIKDLNTSNTGGEA